MKIVLIHGQNHKGSSYHIGRLLVDKLGANNSVTEFFLPRDLNHFCLGCYNCLTDDTKCPFYDDKRRILDSIEEADLLIFTSPTYCLRPSAPMKSLFDFFFTYWMVHRPRKFMFSKKAVAIATSAGASTKGTVKEIALNFFYWGIPWVKKYGIPVAAANWESVSDKKKAKIDHDMARLAHKINSKGTPHVGFKTKFIFNVMKSMHKGGMSADKSEDQYWNDMGWFGKSRPWNDK